MAPEKTVKVRILAHPGNSNAGDDTPSGVQTSEGDAFAGDVVELPEGEAKLLIAANRAEEDEADAPTPKRGRKTAADAK